MLVALAGPRMAGGSVRWWFDPSLGVAVFYAGIVALSAAWLALGRVALTARELSIIGAAWCVPLLLTAPLFSQDAYSYLAQGTLVHLGIDPYRHAPAVLAKVGHAHVLSAVDPFWRHTTTPYGPLFLWIVSGIVAIAGSHWFSACSCSASSTWLGSCCWRCSRRGWRARSAAIRRARRGGCCSARSSCSSWWHRRTTIF